MNPNLSALLSSTAASEVLAVLSSGERILALDVERVGRAGRADAGVDAPRSIAVMKLHGAVTPRGTSGMEGFRARLQSMVDNPDVGAIVLDIDSPGGTVAGTAETGDAVRAAAAVKPVVAIADTLAASAAYWIASQASQLWVTPSGEVGSIGVFGVHLDVSKALADAGVVPTIIKSEDSPYKAELTPFQPLSDEALANVQGRTNAELVNFHRAVAQGRNVSVDRVKSEFGQGRTVSAQRAVELGMADRVGTMSDVLNSLRTKSGMVRRRTALAFA